MRVFDFLFVYEIKSRELETICLLKYELERRGYTVKIAETWQHNFRPFRPINAKVCVVFALYDDGQIQYFFNFATEIKKIVNLYWEQIFNNAEENDNLSSHVVRDYAKMGVHLCWGDKSVRRLLDEYLVPCQNIFRIGHIAYDFFRPQLTEYFMTRDDVLRKYNICVEKKVLLFISSFAFIGMPDSTLNTPLYQNCGFDPFKFRNISEKSQAAILGWFQSALIDNPDYEIIYRPHPAEVGSELLVIMQNENRNFHVLTDFSVKQWIFIADKVCTWISTSIAEVYAASKGCSILRPFAIPYEADIPIYSNASFISDYESFISSLLHPNDEQSIDPAILHEYYYQDDKVPSYMLACSVLENVLRNDQYSSDCFEQLRPMKLKKRNGARRVLGRILNRTLMILLRTEFGQRITSKFLRSASFMINERIFAIKMARKNYASESEITSIQKRIATTLKYNSK